MDGYLKWAATITLIIGTVINSAGYYPQGPIVLLLGGLMWLAVAIRWREPALIATNAIMGLAGTAGLIWAALS